MNRTDKVILYHAYGLPYIYDQVLFSILTLYHHIGGNFEGIRVVVYTDNPVFLFTYQKLFPLLIEPLSEDQIKKYKGERNFVHRVKICILQDCFLKYDADILYLDTDTYFRESPRLLLKKIDAHSSIMNSNDYDLLSADKLYKNNDWLLIHEAIKNYKYNIDNEQCSIPLTTRMWNAGVIGISVQNKQLLQNILDLTDQIYTNVPVFTAEQFAMSFYLQNKSCLTSSENVIFHYWQYFEPYNYRKIYQHYFKKFFKQNHKAPIGSQAAQAYELTLQHHNLKLPQMLVKRIYHRLRRLISSITKDK